MAEPAASSQGMIRSTPYFRPHHHQSGNIQHSTYRTDPCTRYGGILLANQTSSGQVTYRTGQFRWAIGFMWQSSKAERRLQANGHADGNSEPRTPALNTRNTKSASCPHRIAEWRRTWQPSGKRDLPSIRWCSTHRFVRPRRSLAQGWSTHFTGNARQAQLTRYGQVNCMMVLSPQQDAFHCNRKSSAEVTQHHPCNGRPYRIPPDVR